MFYSIKSFILKKIYKLLIIKTVILPKKDIHIYEKLHTYLKVNINSSKGIFVFNFKKDRRALKRKTDLLVKYFIVELEVPDSLSMIDNDINNKVLVVVKVVIFPIDYKILSELLIELYLDNFLKGSIK